MDPGGTEKGGTLGFHILSKFNFICSLIALACGQKGERSCNWVNPLYCANRHRKAHPAPRYLNKLHLQCSDSAGRLFKSLHLFGSNAIKISHSPLKRGKFLLACC